MYVYACTNTRICIYRRTHTIKMNDIKSNNLDPHKNTEKRIKTTFAAKRGRNCYCAVSNCSKYINKKCKI